MSNLHSILLNLIGEYQPIVVDLSDNSQIVCPDWSWILSCVLFILVIYSFFRMVGGLVCKQW